MRNINLLPIEYKRKSELHKELRRLTAYTAVIFFFFILIVIVTQLTINLFELKISSNSANLNALQIESSEEMWREAAKISKQLEYKSYFGISENIETKYLLTVVNEMKEIKAREISIDNNEQTITVSGDSKNKKLVDDFITKLNGKNCFNEINLIEFEKVEQSYRFTLELRLGAKS